MTRFYRIEFSAGTVETRVLEPGEEPHPGLIEITEDEWDQHRRARNKARKQTHDKFKKEDR